MGNDLPLTVLVSQLVEKFAHNEKVVGSSPIEDTNLKTNFMKYRKKPVVIEAVKLEDLEIYTLVSIQKLFGLGKDIFEFKEDGLVIKTLEGNMKASIGDWIIKGVQGEFYPCKPDIFEKTYELVE